VETPIVQNSIPAWIAARSRRQNISFISWHFFSFLACSGAKVSSLAAGSSELAIVAALRRRNVICTSGSSAKMSIHAETLFLMVERVSG
jgi:hypothetical protein